MKVRDRSSPRGEAEEADNRRTKNERVRCHKRKTQTKPNVAISKSEEIKGYGVRIDPSTPPFSAARRASCRYLARPSRIRRGPIARHIPRTHECRTAPMIGATRVEETKADHVRVIQERKPSRQKRMKGAERTAEKERKRRKQDNKAWQLCRRRWSGGVRLLDKLFIKAGGSGPYHYDGRAGPHQHDTPISVVRATRLPRHLVWRHGLRLVINNEPSLL